MALPFRRNVPAITDDDARTWWAGDFLTALRAATSIRLLVLASLGQLIPSVNKRPPSCAGTSASSWAASPVRVKTRSTGQSVSRRPGAAGRVRSSSFSEADGRRWGLTQSGPPRITEMDHRKRLRAVTPNCRRCQRAKALGEENPRSVEISASDCERSLRWRSSNSRRMSSMS